MIPAFRANWLVAALLAAAALLTPAPAAAQSTRDQVRVIEQDYSRTHSGRVISDAHSLRTAPATPSGIGT